MTDYYLKYGNCYLIKIKKTRYNNMVDIISRCAEFKYQTYINQSKDNIYVLIINTFNRPAHDLYFDLKGDHIFKLDGFSSGVLLEMLEDCKTL